MTTMARTRSSMVFPFFPEVWPPNDGHDPRACAVPYT